MFTQADVGCHVDAAFGSDHRRARLIDLVNSLPPTQAIPGTIIGENSQEFRVGLLESLAGPTPDDAWDEDAAIDLLSEVTEPGLVWIMDAGDLILTTEDEAEC